MGDCCEESIERNRAIHNHVHHNFDANILEKATDVRPPLYLGIP
jgi:hypothetical protein